MALEQTIVDMTDRLANKAENGGISFSATPATPIMTVTSGKVTLYAWAKAMGKLVKTSDAQPQLSADRLTVTYTGQAFERDVVNTLEFGATFAGDEASLYNLGSVPVPAELNDKFGEKLDKKITAGLQKAGLLV